MKVSSHNQLTLKEVEDISRKWSIHPILCALWGFNGGHSELGNPYRAIQVDILHQSDIGIFKTLVSCLREMVRERLVLNRKVFMEMDKQLLQLKKESRFLAFRIPGNDKGGYFTSNANFAAFEHRAVMQVIIPCMIGLFPEATIHTFVLFLKWYHAATRSSLHTEASLEQLDILMARVVDSFKTILSQFQKSGFNIIKVHMMSHFSECIRRSGLTWEYSTNQYEQMHIVLMKVAYRASNKRAATLQILNHNRRLESLRKISLHMDGFKNRYVKEKTTALDRAVSIGENVLSGPRANLRMNWVDPDNLSFSSTQVMIPNVARVLLNAQPELKDVIHSTLHTYMTENNFHNLPNTEFEGGMLLQVHSSLAIPAGPGERFGDWPMYARATNHFFGLPWYSSIAIQMEGRGDENINTSFGEIRLLFKVNLYNESNVALTKELALVKMYEVVPQNRVSRLIDCIELRWCTGYYLVVEVANILKVVHVVPNFAIPNRFFINAFKF